MASGYDEIQQLRRLVDPRADFHLANWGRWRRIPDGPTGYRSRSAGLESGGISGADAFENMVDAEDMKTAEICDAIIDGMELTHRIALQHVYEAAVWRLTRMNLDAALQDAAAVFWAMAQGRGLI